MFNFWIHPYQRSLARINTRTPSTWQWYRQLPHLHKFKARGVAVKNVIVLWMRVIIPHTGYWKAARTNITEIQKARMPKKLNVRNFWSDQWSKVRTLHQNSWTPYIRDLLIKHNAQNVIKCCCHALAGWKYEQYNMIMQKAYFIWMKPFCYLLAHKIWAIYAFL